MEFHETKYGANFFNNQLPKLIKSIENLTNAIREIHPSSSSSPCPPSELCHVCTKYNNGEYHINCSDCLNNGFGSFIHINKKP